MTCVCLQGAGTEEDTLIEIFASRSNSQISALSEVYSQGDRGGRGLYNLFICGLTRPPRSHACFCHREGEDIDLWSKEGGLWRLLKSSAPPRRGLSKAVVPDLSLMSVRQSKDLVTDVFLKLKYINLTGFWWFFKGKREESTTVDEGKAKEDAKVSREVSVVMVEHILTVHFPPRPFIKPGRRNWAPMRWNSSTSSAKGASLSSNRVGHLEQIVSCVDPLWPTFSPHVQRLWNTRAWVGKRCRRALRVRCRGIWSRCCSPSVSRKMQEISDKPGKCVKHDGLRSFIEPLLPFSSQMREQCSCLLCRTAV